MSKIVNWGNQVFYICEPNGSIKDAPGVYIFAAQNLQGQWYPLYVGQTENLNARLSSHERWTEAERSGATHIHAVVLLDQASRDRVEKAIIQGWKPPLNSQLK